MSTTIWLIEDGEQVDISPGWNKQMAMWLRETPHTNVRHVWDTDCVGIVSVFTTDAIPTLERLKHDQRKGIEEPPYDTSKNWTACFDRIIAKIHERGEAIVLVDW